MATTAITGKQFTFTYDSEDGTAQVTTGSIEESAESETIQTLGGSVAISQGVTSTISCEFLYDGDQTGGGFYAALKASLESGLPGTITIVGGTGATTDPDWEGEAIVTSLSAEFPADGAVTCSAEFTVSGALAFTPGT